MTKLSLPPTVGGARILGVGDYRPSRVLTNDEISTMVETSDSWIRERTGIARRRIAAPDESVADMATAAAGKALAAAGLQAADIDLILVATCSVMERMPAVAPTVAHRLGTSSPGAIDLNAACAGFSYAISQAADAIRAGSARNVLAIGAEKLSDFVDWSDRGTCILFADGAGAAVVGPAENPQIGPVVWGSEGARGQLITIDTESNFLKMDGQAVFRWATTALAPVAREACARAGIAPAELRVLVPHQANLRIIDALVRSLKLTDVVVARDVVESGNTSAASIPLGLTALVESGEVRSGDPALLLGFGAGLTYAAQVVLCP
ncbi:MAG: ketoacyl-ACP synthase III [Actinomycetota bacterium]|nr:ketoacyl-ACP synthase III [Actinomycetota bacterium]